MNNVRTLQSSDRRQRQEEPQSGFWSKMARYRTFHCKHSQQSCLMCALEGSFGSFKIGLYARAAYTGLMLIVFRKTSLK